MTNAFASVRINRIFFPSPDDLLRWASTEFRYAAEQFDDTVNLIYLRARHYDPTTGRFLSKDPAGGKLSSPVTQNKYVYAGNNPVNGGDPTGLHMCLGGCRANGSPGILPMTIITSPSSGGGVSAGRPAPSMGASSSSPPTPVPDRTRISCSGYSETTVNAVQFNPPSDPNGKSPIGVPQHIQSYVFASASVLWEGGLANVFSSIVFDNLKFAFRGLYDRLGIDYYPDTGPSMRPPNTFVVSGGGAYARDPDMLPRVFDIFVGQRDFTLGFKILNDFFSVELYCR
ncbi:MAG: RHS repeat-associated core domain-containing protein [Chloroflexi bacterium]|nr:RHS repeat-associated core domain-containing protein [Chloroflexota bacterium]